MEGFKRVGKNKYLQFLDNYPRTLNYELNRTNEPAIGMSEDFSNAKKWPQSLVAYIEMECRGEKEKYFLKDDI